MSSRLLFVPVVETAEQFHDLVARAAFHLHFVNPGAVTFFVADGAIAGAEATNATFTVPAGMDPAVARHHEMLRERVDIRPASSLRVDEALDGADRVLLWDRRALEDGPWAEGLAGNQVRSRTFYVDKHRDRMEGSAFVDLGNGLFPHRRRELQKSRGRFRTWVGEMGRFSDAYLLGTGPSIERFADHRFDGLTVACNTAILDEELMRHTRPRILTFADPIFHFGISQYAASYRAAMVEAVNRYGLRVVIPFKYYGLFQSLVPEVANRTVGVPMRRLAAPNLDMMSTYVVKAIDNVLTMMMLPIAATMADDLHLIGFDGRSPEETYFWKHSRRTQFHDKLAVVREVHPGFFDLSYEDYYERHVGNVEAFLLAAEREGHRVDSLVPSHIPALKRRQAGPPAPMPAPTAAAPAYRLVSINPDWMDEFGHHAQFDRMMRPVVEEAGGEMVSLTSRALVPEDPAREVPTFTHPTWAVGHGARRVFVESFRRELRQAVADLFDAAPDVPVRLMMYTAGIWHLPALLETALAFRDRPLEVYVNLLRAHDEVLAAVNEPDGADSITAVVLAEAATIGPAIGVRLFADSEEFGEAFEKLTGIALPLWPMFSVSDLDLGGAAQSADRPAGAPLRVYCPSMMQVPKGYDLMAAAYAGLAPEAAALGMRLVARAIPQPTGTSPEIAAAAELLRDSGIEMIEGVLEPDEYARQMQIADIIVIPYREDPFWSRTSAVFSDAVLLGKPVVATRTTWAGRHTDDLKVGTTFADGDADDLQRAIREAVAGYAALAARTREVAPRWGEENSPAALLAAFDAAAARAGGPAPQAVEERTALVGHLLRLVDEAEAGRDEAARAMVVTLDARVHALDHQLENATGGADEVTLDAIRQRDHRISVLEAQVEDLRTTFGNRLWRALKAIARRLGLKPERLTWNR